MKFLFDLDGTVTSQETLPLIAKQFDCQAQINDLTDSTIKGNIPFVESFIQRVNILSKYSVREISELLSGVSLYHKLLSFIQTHKDDCVIVTGNLDCWCEQLFKKIGCKYFASTAEVIDDKVVKLKSILRKEQIVEVFKSSGETVVFIGDGNNDLEAMRSADIGIAVGITHNPATSLLSVCDYVIFNEDALCRQLNQLLGIYSDCKSIVISCAGIGSRLGLGLTKALLQINGSSLISLQLKLFNTIKDIRIVIGFQACEIIKEVLNYRKDVIFCFNHHYFETKTGASFFLGARHGNQYSIEWDGDLLVHPDDVDSLLKKDGEFVCYSDISSEDAVYVRVGENGNVSSFSTQYGDFEWTGPACMHKDHLQYSSRNVFNMFEPFCPMYGIKVRAYDIDTYDDYVRVSDVVKDWGL